MTKFKKRALSFLLVSIFASTCLFAQVSGDSLERYSRLEKLVDRLRIEGKNTVFYIAPSCGYDPNSGWEFGLLPLLSISPKGDSLQQYRSSRYSGFYSYSSEGWTNLKTEIDLYSNNAFHINSKLQYVAMPQKYYTVYDYPSHTGDYKQSRFNTKLELAYFLTPSFQLGVGFEYDFTNISDEVIGDSGLPYSMERQDHKKLPSLTFLYDSRDYNNYPSKGFYLQSEIGYIFLDDNRMNSIYLGFDLRSYTSVGKKNIVALQVAAQYSNGAVSLPYYYSFKIGGKDKLRGFKDNNMYRSSQAYFTQVEYRRMLFWRFGLAIFSGVGCIESPWVYTYTYGAGLRFLASEKDKLNFRIDYGRSKYNNSSVFITVGEAF